MDSIGGPAGPAEIVFRAEVQNIHVGPLDRQGPRSPIPEHAIAAQPYPDIH